MFVKKSDLPSTSRAFQQYMADFFAERTILGVECMYAAIRPSVNGYDWTGLGPGKGVAPWPQR